MSTKIIRIMLIVFISFVLIILLPHVIVNGIGSLIPILIILAIIVWLYIREEKRKRLMHEALTKLNAKTILPLGSVISGLDRYPGKKGYLAITDQSLFILSYYKSIICGELLKSSIKNIEVQGSSNLSQKITGASESAFFKGNYKVHSTTFRSDIYHLIIAYKNHNNASIDLIIEYEGNNALSNATELKIILKNEIGLS